MTAENFILSLLRESAKKEESLEPTILSHLYRGLDSATLFSQLPTEYALSQIQIEQILSDLVSVGKVIQTISGTYTIKK